MAVTLELNEASQLFLVVPEPETLRSEILDTLKGAVDRHPKMATWHCIADLRHPLAGPLAFDLSSLVPLFDREGSKPALTVLLTDQPRMAHWVLVLNYQFKSRRFCVASSMSEALGLVERGTLGYARSWA